MVRQEDGKAFGGALPAVKTRWEERGEGNGVFAPHLGFPLPPGWPKTNREMR